LLEENGTLSVVDDLTRLGIQLAEAGATRLVIQIARLPVQCGRAHEVPGDPLTACISRSEFAAAHRVVPIAGPLEERQRASVIAG
jgi:hypothetical protein